MRKTYAANSIIIGILIGILVAVQVNPVLGVMAGIAVTAAGWLAIRFIEKLIGKGVDAAGKAIAGAIDRNKGSK